MRHLIDPLYFSVQETEELLDIADDICDNMDKYKDKMFKIHGAAIKHIKEIQEAAG